jgi:hypothetical protein
MSLPAACTASALLRCLPHRTDCCRPIRWRRGVKGRFACTFSQALSPVLVVLRPQTVAGCSIVTARQAVEWLSEAEANLQAARKSDAYRTRRLVRGRDFCFCYSCHVAQAPFKSLGGDRFTSAKLLTRARACKAVVTSLAHAPRPAKFLCRPVSDRIGEYPDQNCEIRGVVCQHFCRLGYD